MRLILPTSHNHVESLERRELLAADLAVAELAPAAPLATEVDGGGVEGTDVASFYAGRLKFLSSPAENQQRRLQRDVVINVTSAAQNGAFTGTLFSAGLGNVTFSGEMTRGRQFSADVTGDVSGSLHGEIRNRGGRFVASITTGGQQIGIQARSASPMGQTVVLPADGVVGDELPAGTVALTGLAGGRATLDSRLDDPTLADADFTPNRLRNDVSLEITDQTSTGLLGGQLTIGERTVPVNGIAGDGRVTLLVLPEPGTTTAANIPTGVLRLNLNPFGTGLNGRFSNAGAPGVLDLGRFALTRVEPVGAQTVPSFGSIGGLIGAIEAGSFRGDPLTTTGIGTPASTGTAIGTPIEISPVGVNTTRISPVFSGTEIGRPASTGTEVGTPIFTGATISSAPRSFTSSTTSAGQLLDSTRSGGTGGLFA